VIVDLKNVKPHVRTHARWIAFLSHRRPHDSGDRQQNLKHFTVHRVRIDIRHLAIERVPALANMREVVRTACADPAIGSVERSSALACA
jgi:hypothetical protein